MSFLDDFVFVGKTVKKGTGRPVGEGRDERPFVTVSRNGKGLHLNPVAVRKVEEYGANVKLGFDVNTRRMALILGRKPFEGGYRIYVSQNGNKSKTASISCEEFIQTFDLDRTARNKLNGNGQEAKRYEIKFTSNIGIAQL